MITQNKDHRLSIIWFVRQSFTEYYLPYRIMGGHLSSSEDLCRVLLEIATDIYDRESCLVQRWIKVRGDRALPVAPIDIVAICLFISL